MAEQRYNDRIQIVWLHEEQCHGSIIKEGAYFSLVRYQKDGMDYEVFVDNGDFSVIDEIGFEHIEEYEDGPDTLL
jgi:hypothetical protein